MEGQKRQKVAILPKLYDAGGDLNKQWFIYYSFRDPESGKMQRIKLFGFKHLKTARGRRAYAEKKIQELKEKIVNGWSPGQEQQVTYENNLRYQINGGNVLGSVKNVKGFNYYINLFLQSKTSIRPSTYTSYKSKFRYLETFVKQEKLSLKEFGMSHAAEFNTYLRVKRKLTNKTINEYNVLMKTFYFWLIENGIVMNNAFQKQKKLPVVSKKPLVYRLDLLGQISKQVEKSDPQLLLIIRLIFNCFIRPGELRQLKIKNIDWTRGVITIPASVAKTKRQRISVVPNYLMVQLKKFNGKYAEDDYIITAKGCPGSRMASRNYMYNRFVRLKKQMGLSKDYILYAFKHTGMVELKRSGADWMDVKDQAGHRSLDQTIAYTSELMKDGESFIKRRGPKM